MADRLRKSDRDKLQKRKSNRDTGLQQQHAGSRASLFRTNAVVQEIFKVFPVRFPDSSKRAPSVAPESSKHGPTGIETSKRIPTGIEASKRGQTGIESSKRGQTGIESSKRVQMGIESSKRGTSANPDSSKPAERRKQSVGERPANALMKTPPKTPAPHDAEKTIFERVKAPSQPAISKKHNNAVRGHEFGADVITAVERRTATSAGSRSPAVDHDAEKTIFEKVKAPSQPAISRKHHTEFGEIGMERKKANAMTPAKTPTQTAVGSGEPLKQTDIEKSKMVMSPVAVKKKSSTGVAKDARVSEKSKYESMKATTAEQIIDTAPEQKKDQMPNLREDFGNVEDYRGNFAPESDKDKSNRSPSSGKQNDYQASAYFSIFK